MKKNLTPITKSHQKHRLENTKIYTTIEKRKEERKRYGDRRFYGKIC